MGFLEGYKAALAYAAASRELGRSPPAAAHSYWGSGVAAPRSIAITNSAWALGQVPATPPVRGKSAAAAAEAAVCRENPAVARNKDPRLLGIYTGRIGPSLAYLSLGRDRAPRHCRVAVPIRPTSAICSLCSRRHRAERARRTCRCRFATKRSEIH